MIEHCERPSVIPPGSTGRDPAVRPQGAEGLSECSSREDSGRIGRTTMIESIHSTISETRG